MQRPVEDARTPYRRRGHRPATAEIDAHAGRAERMMAPRAHRTRGLWGAVGLIGMIWPSTAAAGPPAPEATRAAATTPADDAQAPADDDEPGWSDFELGGAHGFVGIAVGPALMGDWYYGNPPDWHPGMLVAIRGGALFDHVELAAEIAPVSMWWSFSEPPLFSFNLTIGGQLELAPNVYWPLRFGLGATAVNMPHDTAAMQARLDLIGVIYRVGHVEIELDLLSARFSSEFQDFGLWSAPFTLAGSYVF